MTAHKIIAKGHAWPFMPSNMSPSTVQSAQHFDLPIKKMQGGKLIPYVLRIERGTGILLEERRVDVPVSLPAPATVQDARIIQTTERFGAVVQTVEQDGKIRHIVRADLSDRRKISWMQDFFDKSKPCYFEGCEALRMEYERRLASLGDDCTTCALSALVQEFNVILEASYDPTSDH